MFVGDNFDINECGQIDTNYCDKLSYNPINDVHWRRSGDDGEFDWDNSDYDLLVTNGNKIFIMQESVSLV